MRVEYEQESECLNFMVGYMLLTQEAILFNVGCWLVLNVEERNRKITKSTNDRYGITNSLKKKS